MGGSALLESSVPPPHLRAEEIEAHGGEICQSDRASGFLMPGPLFPPGLQREGLWTPSPQEEIPPWPSSQPKPCPLPPRQWLASSRLMAGEAQDQCPFGG